MLAQFINICAIVIPNDYCSGKDMAFKIIEKRCYSEKMLIHLVFIARCAIKKGSLNDFPF